MPCYMDLKHHMCCPTPSLSDTLLLLLIRKGLKICQVFLELLKTWVLVNNCSVKSCYFFFFDLSVKKLVHLQKTLWKSFTKQNASSVLQLREKLHVFWNDHQPPLLTPLIIQPQWLAWPTLLILLHTELSRIYFLWCGIGTMCPGMVELFIKKLRSWSLQA